MLALIITRATGSSLSVEFRRRFWQPLGLKNAYLSMEEQIPDRLAHVWGDNFENDGSFRDITFLPRASHESITYGSAGLFMTAENLARWCHSLFEGKVLRQSSLDEMLTIGKDGYGLGVQVFHRRHASSGPVGHRGDEAGKWDLDRAGSRAFQPGPGRWESHDHAGRQISLLFPFQSAASAL